jgi:GGDEF domain-containing protein
VAVPGLTDPVKAESMARDLLAALQRPIVTSVGADSLGAAIGVVVTPAQGVSTPSATALFHRAENAVKLAKKLGPQGGVHVWSRDDPDDVSRERGDNR